MDAAPAISFVLATENDIPLIRALSEIIWREHYPGIISREQIEYMLDMKYAEEALRQDMRGGSVYEIATVEGQAAGFLSYARENPARVKLDKLYLKAEFRGRGLGRRMLEHVRDSAVGLGAREVYLYVNKRNSKAIAAYERFGFLRAESVVTDIGSGFVMDDYLMRCNCDDDAIGHADAGRL